MTLLILAAGMGSRYGGLKQLDPMTPHGEFIIDFSIYDALHAGFNRVVFVIKKENYDLFRDTVGKRVEKQIKTEYVFQDINDLPAGFTFPQGRIKPWGTTHAVLSAASVLGTDSFAVINADDFYGRDTFEKLAGHLSKTTCDVPNFCMVGYVLKNTMTENGAVSRGECHVDENGILLSVHERTGIIRKGDTAVCEDDDKQPMTLPLDTVVSMNCWGFTAPVLTGMKTSFHAFLDKLKDADDTVKLKKECYLPNSVAEMIEAGTCSVRVYRTDAVWHGVTYHEDKEEVKGAIAALVAAGEYPDGLWN